MLSGAILMAVTLSAQAPVAQPTVDALQSDLETASPCDDTVDGRKVWKGELAFYIQSYVYENQTDGDTADQATDAVLPGDNPPDTMEEFERACRRLSQP